MRRYYVIEVQSGKDVSGPMSSRMAAEDYCERRVQTTKKQHAVEWL